jgi:hypothetical protein
MHAEGNQPDTAGPIRRAGAPRPALRKLNAEPSSRTPPSPCLLDRRAALRPVARTHLGRWACRQSSSPASSTSPNLIAKTAIMMALATAIVIVLSGNDRYQTAPAGTRSAAVPAGPACKKTRGRTLRQRTSNVGVCFTAPLFPVPVNYSVSGASLLGAQIRRLCSRVPGSQRGQGWRHLRIRLEVARDKLESRNDHFARHATPGRRGRVPGLVRHGRSLGGRRTR